ncbi:hypothetical protein LSUE1_G007539, partial [Lachnellula suecica]
MCCIIGFSGLAWLCIKNRENHIWLVDRVFFPGALNALMGLITTLINVYTAQD